MNRVVPSLIALALVGACSTPTAGREEARIYVEQLYPLLEENSLLAERVLLLSADVYNGEADSTQARQAWTKDVVPLAAHLHDQAGLLQPPAQWADRHTELVGIWNARSHAYRELGDALDHGDRTGWLEARHTADQAILDEEKWFQELNEEMLPLGLVVDQFP